MQEQSQGLGQEWEMGWHCRSLHVPVGPCKSLCCLDSSSSPCSGCTRGMLSPPGRRELVEAKHWSIPVPGLGDAGGLQGCCQLPGCLSCSID